MRRLLVLALMTGFFLERSSSARSSPQDPASGKPNVVLIVSDYMGYGDIGSFGATDIRTPNLDRLAREGVRLDNAYAAAPICTPSRVGLLTGRYPQRAGIETNVDARNLSFGLRPEETVIARMLSDAGYATAVFGKWHLGYQSSFMPIAHGFGEFFGHLDWTVDYYSHRTFQGQPGLYENSVPVERKGYITDLLTERSISFIRTHAERPFFLYVAYNAALPPCQPPNRPDDVRSAETWHRSTRADYIQVVEALDAGIGRIVEALDRQELKENTLVIYTYDHGGGQLSRQEPLFHGFSSLWEGGIRVPCLIRWPRRLAGGQTVHHPVINMDLAATMLAAAGVAPPRHRELDGVNLLPVLRRELPETERAFFWRLNLPVRNQKAARVGRWKYIRDGATDMLFDLEKDISERHNLGYAAPGVLQKLKEMLAGWEAGLPAPQAAPGLQ